VVEIGALNHRCVHQDALYELLLDSLPKRGQRPSRRTKKPRFTRPRTVQKRATNGRGFRQWTQIRRWTIAFEAAESAAT